MSWKVAFDKGVACFKHGHLDDALAHMNQAAQLQGNAFIVYDSRAAVYEKLGNLKNALLDSKRVIDLVPDKWQGYARSARLFDLLGKYDSVVKMADHALSRLRPEDVWRYTQLIELREKARAAAETLVTQTSYLLGKLPVETMVEIFTMLIDEDHTWSVTLSHICRHWRRILVNTPSAWQKLVLSRRHPLQKAKLWKQRAKNRIAHISVISVSPLDRASVFAQLQDISWENLSGLFISGEAFAELHRMLSDISLPHAFSNLDELDLVDFKSSEQLSCYLSGSNCKLRILRIDGRSATKVAIDEWWQRIQQLKELHITAPRLRLPMLMFTANPLLERLCLDSVVCEPVASKIAIECPVPMVNLKSVTCRNNHNPFDFLRRITAPSITHFGMFTVAAMAQETLFHMASRPSLVELRISVCGLSPSALPTLLSCTPKLETLQIMYLDGIVNALFEFLTPKTDDLLPCRVLKHVDVSGCSDLTTSSLYAFVKTRAQYAVESVGSGETCAVIASLTVDGCPHIEPDMLPWFRSKVAQFSCVYATRQDFRKKGRLYSQLST